MLSNSARSGFIVDRPARSKPGKSVTDLRSGKMADAVPQVPPMTPHFEKWKIVVAEDGHLKLLKD